MIPYDSALQILRDEAKKRSLQKESVYVSDSLSRILSTEVTAMESLPGFDNSAMDGFAVRSQDLVFGRNEIKVLARVIAGDSVMKFNEERVAIEIMTGAPIPQGDFDLIVKVEDVLRSESGDGDRMIVFQNESAKSEFIRKAGSDFKSGARVSDAGTLVDSNLLMGLSALGVKTVEVFKKPKLVLVSTGNEIVEPDAETLLPGEVRNATAPYLMAELKRLGCEVIYLGVVKDEAKGVSLEFRSKLHSALLEGADLVVTTGAVSMGVHDFIPECVQELGGEIRFHRVGIKPGKPILVAGFESYPKTLFFGLPGNPVSTAVGTCFFIKPYLAGLHGLPAFSGVASKLKEKVEKPMNLRCFYKAHFEIDQEGMSQVEVLEGQASFMIHSLTRANAFVVLPEGKSYFEAEDRVQVFPLSGEGLSL